MKRSITIIKRFIYVNYIMITLISCGQNLQEKTGAREVFSLKEGWKFTREDDRDSHQPDFDDSSWKTVRVPHDWAIYGPFDETLDQSEIIVIEDGERTPKIRKGRTGGLPYQGVGWYRKSLLIQSVDKLKKVFLEFDGAMSHAKIYFNGQYVGEWPYGYSSFSFDVTRFVNFGGKNQLAVRLENPSFLSRWYPGAGIYRNVRLVYTHKTHVSHWGTYITTPEIQNGSGKVNVSTTLSGIENDNVQLVTAIYDPSGTLVATKEDLAEQSKIEQELMVKSPQLWELTSPEMYTAISKVVIDGQIVDQYATTFGFRFIQFTPDDGFHLNGKRVQLKGVCLHHDLGPLGTAVNTSAIYRQLRIMKEMGANAIRTAHNPPAPELLNMCDTMGLLVIDEAFDEWAVKKVENGYHQLWDEWAEKDLTSLIHRDRNHPSVIMWSMGNEIREQKEDNAWEKAKFLVDLAHREDPSRPTTIGMNANETVINNNFAAQFDVKGWNYHMNMITKAKAMKPEWKIYASETQSTISSRGFYDTDGIPKKHHQRENLLTSAYGLDYCNWCNTADEGFATIEDNPFVAGEFVWTGFDYLGEPTPYNEQWPTRSSHFGLVDLVGLPKDIYYQYQAHWSSKDVLHILPHWNWEVGQNVPVHVFTSFDKAELFVNGESKGVKEKNREDRYQRFRLKWDSVRFEPGEIKVVALSTKNKVLKAQIVKTASKPYAIKLLSERKVVKADGEDLVYIEVQIVDKNGVLCPNANNEISFEVSGNGTFRAAGNGDPRDVTLFHSNKRKAFYGKCVAILQAGNSTGNIELIATSNGLLAASASLKTIQ